MTGVTHEDAEGVPRSGISLTSRRAVSAPLDLAPLDYAAVVTFRAATELGQGSLKNTNVVFVGRRDVCGGAGGMRAININITSPGRGRRAAQSMPELRFPTLRAHQLRWPNAHGLP